MKTFLTFLFVIILSLGLSNSTKAQTANLSKEELKLLKAVLETALEIEKNLPDYNSLLNNNEVFLLDKMVAMDDVSKAPVYLSAKQIPALKNIKFKLITEAELKDTTRQEDILFVRLGQITLPAEKEQPAITYILAQWAIGKNSKEKGFVHKQAFGNAMGFKKTKKDWEYIKTYYTFQNELGL